MSSLRLCLLGPPRLERNGAPLELDTRKNTALVTYLAVTGECHSREALITLLWPELEPSRARIVTRVFVVPVGFRPRLSWQEEGADVAAFCRARLGRGRTARPPMPNP